MSASYGPKLDRTRAKFFQKSYFAVNLFILPALFLGVEIWHLTSSEAWRLGYVTDEATGNHIPIHGLVVDWIALVIALMFFSAWLANTTFWLQTMFADVHERLENKSSKQEGDLAVIFNALHAHSGKSKRLENLFKSVAAGFWELTQPRGGTGDDHGKPGRGLTSVESRVFRLLREARDTVSDGRFDLIPWTPQQFEQYPEHQYGNVNSRVCATNVGSVGKDARFFGRNGIYLDAFITMNEDAILRGKKTGLKIERIFVFKKDLLKDAEEKSALFSVMRRMQRCGVEVKYLHEENAVDCLVRPADGVPDFAIFTTKLEGGCEVKEMGRCYDLGVLVENRKPAELSAMSVIECDIYQTNAAWSKNWREITQNENLFGLLKKRSTIFTDQSDLSIQIADHLVKCSYWKRFLRRFHNLI